MKRNWKRYTIRSGLIAVTVVAIFFAYVSSIVSSLAPRSRDYAAIFREHGAAVHYEPIDEHRWLHPFLPLTYATTIDAVVLSDPKHDGETLTALTPRMNAFDSCRQLSLQHSAITDDDLQQLSKMDNLESLELRGANFSDAGLLHVAKLDHLQQLDISKTQITAAGIKQLRDSLPYCAINADVPVPPIKIRPVGNADEEQ